MKNETYLFVSDVADKKVTARSARNRRTHTGKGGRVRFPSDNLSKKELENMSGEVKSYKLNEPMTWEEFKAMPIDIQSQYIMLLRKRYGVSCMKIDEFFGNSNSTLQKHVKNQGLPLKWERCDVPFDKEGWLAFTNGVPYQKKTEDSECKEETEEAVDIPVDNGDIPAEPVVVPQKDRVYEVVQAVPKCGEMQFRCPADQAFRAIENLLGKAKVCMTISWSVLEDDDEE